MLLAYVVLIQLHTVDGGVIEINPREITTMRPRHEHENFAKGAECMINMSDGKFVAVREDCVTVEEMTHKKEQ